MALFGRVPFGRANSDPRSILVQIIYVCSIFLITLSICILVMELLSGVGRMFTPITVGDTSGTQQSSVPFDSSLPSPTVVPTTSTTAASVMLEKTKTHSQFYLSVTSLVSPSQIGVSSSYAYSAAKFIISHILAAFISSIPIAICIERRRFAVDFVLTIYGVYFILTCIVTQSFPLTGSWWFGTLFGLVFNLLATIQLCYRREMAEVLLEGSAGMAKPAYSSPGTSALQTEGNNNNNRGGRNAGQSQPHSRSESCSALTPTTAVPYFPS